MIRISLVIPTHNRAAQLVAALESVVRQDLPRDEWECVVVDNNSTDDTAARFEEFRTAHPELPNLFLLTAPSRALGQKIDEKAFACLLQEAREQFDFCLIDSAAGIGDGFRLATEAADRCIIVCTPDPASLRDAACAADLLELRGRRDVRLVVNRVSPVLYRRMQATIDDVMDGVGLPLLGIVPEDSGVTLAAAKGVPLPLYRAPPAPAATLRGGCADKRCR